MVVVYGGKDPNLTPEEDAELFALQWRATKVLLMKEDVVKEVYQGTGEELQKILLFEAAALSVLADEYKFFSKGIKGDTVESELSNLATKALEKIAGAAEALPIVLHDYCDSLLSKRKDEKKN